MCSIYMNSLKSDSFPWLVVEEEVREISSMRKRWCFEDGGAQMAREAGSF